MLQLLLLIPLLGSCLLLLIPENTIENKYKIKNKLLYYSLNLKLYYFIILLNYIKNILIIIYNLKYYFNF